ncbi:hypothetical protein Cantr_04573 [Candida viswanathii]|uniref:Uncharacterized protein n=1 Tax=Candida viswanathii TaxID=5486 RepID=A0A367XL41_9ASCO|nr:hypothetical protein Cantr_04573 [Candida viswanathii]
MSSSTDTTSKKSEPESESFASKLLKLPKSIHHGLHKGADKTSQKVADGTKKVLHQDHSKVLLEITQVK